MPTISEAPLKGCVQKSTLDPRAGGACSIGSDNLHACPRRSTMPEFPGAGARSVFTSSANDWQNYGDQKMGWTEVVARDWTHVVDLFSYADDHPLFQGVPVHRGQSDESWPLRDSLSRLMPSDGSTEIPRKVEQEATRFFVGRARLHLNSSMIPDLKNLHQWWSMMQHFGAPTRLLDWTLSPYIALYFAVAENWNRPGAVWSADYCANLDDDLEALRSRLETETDEQKVFWSNADGPDFCFFLNPGAHHLRSAAQQGIFSVCGRIPSDHGLLLEKTRSENRGLRKTIVPAELKPTFLNKLRMMNIAPHSLFPGLDGLGGTVRDAIRLQLHRPQFGSQRAID
jgi:hypothetical protein